MISSDALQVGRLVLAPESAGSVRLNRIVTAPGPLTGALRAAGVRYVIVDAGPVLARAAAGWPAAGRPAGSRPGASPAALAVLARLPGAQVIIAGPDLVLFRLPSPPASGNGG